MKRLRLGATAALTALTVPALVWADGVHEGAGNYGHMWHDGWGWMIGGPFIMILFVAAVVVLAVLAVRWLAGPGTTQGSKGKNALDILKERFARGEIDKAEFEERHKTLGG